MSIEDVLAELNVERYSRSVWWSRADLPASVTNDSEAACAKRRAAMADDFDRVSKRRVA